MYYSADLMTRISNVEARKKRRRKKGNEMKLSTFEGNIPIYKKKTKYEKHKETTVDSFSIEIFANLIELAKEYDVLCNFLELYCLVPVIILFFSLFFPYSCKISLLNSNGRSAFLYFYNFQ